MNVTCFTDIDLSTKDQYKVRSLLIKKQLEKMWNYIDSLNLNLSQYQEMEVVANINKVVIRIWKNN